MTGRILIVDDNPTNIKLLDARLSAEYYTTVAAHNGEKAIEICRKGDCDLVLLDVMMPGMNGFEVCRNLKSQTETLHIPIVMITALDGTEARIQGLEAGADDFLTKPVGEIELMARVKSLLRVKLLVDELRMRALTAHDVHMELLFERVFAKPTPEEAVLVVDDREASAARIRATLTRVGYQVVVEADPERALQRATENDLVLAIVNLDLRGFDGLRLCSQIRQLEPSRSLPLLAISDEKDDTRLTRALDLGVNDFVRRPVEANELAARCMTQLRRRRYSDFLRESVQNTMEMAVKDALTGLYNRRYLETHLANHVKIAATKATPLSVLILDIDHFKAVNDRFGHAGGDAVLRDFAKCIADNVRRIDLPCRLGGEEFVVVMPETDRELAYSVAERIRSVVARRPFAINEAGEETTITTSIGIACYSGTGDTPATLLIRADDALYNAKAEGRNRVNFEIAA